MNPSYRTGLTILSAMLCLASIEIGTGLAQTPPAAALSPNAALLKGASAWQTLIGNTITVESKAATYTEFFATDGTVKHLDQDGKATGTWSLQGEKVCFDYPVEDDRSCVAVESDGKTGAFVDDDGTRDAFIILPGNAKEL